MPTITTKDGVEIFYKDWGKGQPIVFSHGWPLSADDWDTQMIFFANAGFRVERHFQMGDFRPLPRQILLHRSGELLEHDVSVEGRVGA